MILFSTLMFLYWLLWASPCGVSQILPFGYFVTASLVNFLSLTISVWLSSHLRGTDMFQVHECISARKIIWQHGLYQQILLFNLMRNKLRPRLEFDFSLQFDFYGQLCCLMDSRTLSQKAVLKVFWLESDANSIGTETLPHAPLADCPQGLSSVLP